jgi:hypothetical protein
MVCDLVHGGSGHVAAGHGYIRVHLAVVPSPEDLVGELVWAIGWTRKEPELCGVGNRRSDL